MEILMSRGRGFLEGYYLSELSVKLIDGFNLVNI